MPPGSGFHHHRDDHRSPPGALVHEPPGGPAGLALESLDVADAVAERRLDRSGDGVAGLVEQFIEEGSVERLDAACVQEFRRPAFLIPSTDN